MVKSVRVYLIPILERFPSTIEKRADEDKIRCKETIAML